MERKLIWGLFDGANLVAMTGLNSKAMDIGQVGGVYTKPEYRKRGLGKLAMKKMTNDCIDKMGIKRMILFTGESNIAAQKLYESLDYQRIGHFGLIFC